MDSSQDVMVSSDSGFMARLIADDLSWGLGSIRPQAQYSASQDQRDLIKAVLQSLEPVSQTESVYSICTDGRLPVRLQSGEPIPIREQMVGADMVSAFFVAEILAAAF